jgi:phosphoglycolate phosphatase-like HAD superfamily hydrolase
LALFLRKEEGPFVYAGRAEVANWPVDGNDCWLQLSLDEPLRSPIPQVAPSVEQVLRELALDADREARLRWVAAGDDEAWKELSEELQHQGELSGELVPLAPFLFSLLREPAFPYAEDLIWIFALAAKAPPYLRQAASQGVKTYVALLDSENSALRIPAAFCLQTCADVGEQLRRRAEAEPHEELRAALLAVLGTSRDPSPLPFLLRELNTGGTPFLKAVAALAALEAAPDNPPIDAIRYLQENPWGRFEDLWESIDPVGAAVLDPEDILSRMS